MVIYQGIITRIFPNEVYEVRLNNNEITRAIRSRELKNNFIKVKANDTVLIEFCRSELAQDVEVAKIFKIEK